ncbi:MAG: hypothetical protein ABI885_27275 [Gammaproteobacteria bacterium]
MTLHTIFDYLKRHRPLTGVSVIGLGLALFVVDHSMVKPTEPLLLSSSSIASAQAAVLSTSVSQADALPGPSSAQRFQVTFDERNDGTDGSRECAPDNGISVACVYN